MPRSFWSSCGGQAGKKMKVPEVNIKQLLEAGVHLGHKTLDESKMKNFIFGEKNSIHIIDLTQTVNFLKTALSEVHKCVYLLEEKF